jgi:hypothetical protein
VVRWDTDLGYSGFIGCLADKKDQEIIEVKTIYYELVYNN